jgi:hypothetical protein
VENCPGGLIEHADGTVAGCSEDDERDGCRGRDLRHEGDPVRCWVWSLGGCNYCGVHCIGERDTRTFALSERGIADRCRRTLWP